MNDALRDLEPRLLMAQCFSEEEKYKVYYDEYPGTNMAEVIQIYKRTYC